MLFVGSSPIPAKTHNMEKKMNVELFSTNFWMMVSKGDIPWWVPVIYLVGCAAVGAYAREADKGTFWGFFVGSLIFSPILAGIWALLS